MYKHQLERLRNSLVLRPLRTCRWSHECVICKRDIVDGQRYYDGGLDRRAHEDCVKTKGDTNK